jgi:hypothetical protein
MVKITLSKSQWEHIGKQCGWIRIAKFGDSVKKKYLQQGIDEHIIDSYINDFNIIRNQTPKQLYQDLPQLSIPKNKINNIENYKNFRDLEFIVDYIKGQRQIKKDNAKSNEEANKIFEEDNLVIYRADNMMQAIDAKGDYNVSWCVSRNGIGNMFNSYKYDKYGNEPTFYFVKDLDKERKDPCHFFVIQALKDKYIVTDQYNGGEIEKNWNEILKVQPKLEGKENLIKWIPIPQETKDRLKQYDKILYEEDFIKLPYEQKKEYIEYKGSQLMTDSMFSNLPDDLKNLYINLGAELNDKKFNIIKENKDLLNRYLTVLSRNIEKDDSLYANVPVEVKNHPLVKDAYLTAWINKIEIHPFLYDYCPKELKNHEKIKQAIIQGHINILNQSVSYYNNFQKEIKNIPEIKDLSIKLWIDKIKQNPSNYDYCPVELKKENQIKKVVLQEWVEKVKQNEHNLTYCPEEFKNTQEILNVLPQADDDDYEHRRLWSSVFNNNYIGKIK